MEKKVKEIKTHNYTNNNQENIINNNLEILMFNFKRKNNNNNNNNTKPVREKYFFKLLSEVLRSISYYSTNYLL